MTRLLQWPAAIQRVLDAVLGASGTSRQTDRQTVHDYARGAAGIRIENAELPAALEPYITKLTHSPYKILDRDIDALRAAGFSEDQIFEITAAASLGAAAGRYQRTLELLQEASQ